MIAARELNPLSRFLSKEHSFPRTSQATNGMSDGNMSSKAGCDAGSAADVLGLLVLASAGELLLPSPVR